MNGRATRKTPVRVVISIALDIGLPLRQRIMPTNAGIANAIAAITGPPDCPSSGNAGCGSSVSFGSVDPSSRTELVAGELGRPGSLGDESSPAREVSS